MDNKENEAYEVFISEMDRHCSILSGLTIKYPEFSSVILMAQLSMAATMANAAGISVLEACAYYLDKNNPITSMLETIANNAKTKCIIIPIDANSTVNPKKTN